MRGKRTFSPELIKGIIREIQQTLDNNPQYGWLGKLCDKHGINPTTVRGWLDRYKTPEGVPDGIARRGKDKPVADAAPASNGQERTKPPRRKIMACCATPGNLVPMAVLASPEVPSASQMSYVITNAQLIAEIAGIRSEIVNLKLIIADAYIASVRAEVKL
jgi:hypothetical protein